MNPKIVLFNGKKKKLFLVTSYTFCGMAQLQHTLLIQVFSVLCKQDYKKVKHRSRGRARSQLTGREHRGKKQRENEEVTRMNKAIQEIEGRDIQSEGFER